MDCRVSTANDDGRRGPAILEFEWRRRDAVIEPFVSGMRDQARPARVASR